MEHGLGPGVTRTNRALVAKRALPATKALTPKMAVDLEAVLALEPKMVLDGPGPGPGSVLARTMTNIRTRLDLLLVDHLALAAHHDVGSEAAAVRALHDDQYSMFVPLVP